MNAITGNKAQAMQDLELAKGLTDKVIDELEEQYGEVGDYTMAANKLMLNIQQLTGDWKGAIEQAQHIMELMKENDAESVNTHEYAQNLLVQITSQLLVGQLEAAQHNLNQATNLLASITDEDDGMYEQIYSLQGHIFMKYNMYQDALDWFTKALEHADRTLGENSRSSAQIAAYIAEVHMRTGNQ